jgi:hypothetical protein
MSMSINGESNIKRHSSIRQIQIKYCNHNFLDAGAIKNQYLLKWYKQSTVG